MPFKKGNKPYNTGMKGYKRDKHQDGLSYYQRNKAEIISNVVKSKRRRLAEKAGRPKPENCEVCNSKGRIMYDHDHKTNKFRGWICHNCNVVLGFSKDNPAILKALGQYLIRHYAVSELEKNFTVRIGALGKVLSVEPKTL